jgi:hypothetical protein
MKTISSFVVLATSVFGTSVAVAECPLELPYQNLVDCLVTEGAGDEYPVAEVLATIKEQEAERLQAQARQEALAADKRLIPEAK